MNGHRTARHRFAAGALAVALGLSPLLGCGGSDPAAPTGSIIVLTARFVEADTQTGNFTAVLRALVINQDSGDPQRGVGVLFLVTEGPGRLQSAGDVIETNNAGEAYDVLVGTGADEDNPITVSAVSGKASQTLTIDATGASTDLKLRPDAALTADRTTVAVNTDVEFDVSGSTDPDGTIQTWTIAFGDTTNGGPFTFSSTKKTTHKYTAAGTYTATATLTDNDGLVGNASITITVQ